MNQKVLELSISRIDKLVMTNLSILIFRVRTVAVHFGATERVEKVVADVQHRHRRLVPFAAMVLMGVIAVLFGADSLLHP